MQTLASGLLQGSCCLSHHGGVWFPAGNNTGANQDSLEVISLSLASDGLLGWFGAVLGFFSSLSFFTQLMDDTLWTQLHQGYVGDVGSLGLLEYVPV